MYHVYLAGPITGLSYGEATGWRYEASEALLPEIIPLSPLRCKDYLQGEGVLADQYHGLNVLSSQRGIVARDYNDVRRSDAILVNMLGATRVSIGTVMEIAWAKSFSVPVILVMEEENVHNHAMLRECVDFWVKSIEEACHVTRALILPHY